MVNYLYWTVEVLDAFLQVGYWEVDDAIPYVNWLSSLQNEDGGWGESDLSFVEERYVPAHSTISQTAFILNALLTYEKERLLRGADAVSAKTSILRGVQYLVNQSSPQEYVIEANYTGVILKNLSYGRYYRLPQYETVRVLGKFLTWYWGYEPAGGNHEVMTVTDQISW
jgi:squalene cyclase